MLDRIIRVIKLDQTVFAEIEHDESLTSEAFIIVLAASFLAAIGAAIGSGRFFLSFISSLLSGVILNWIVWSVITLWVGTQIFDGDADLGELLRTIGYANAPRFLGVFQFIPCVGWILALAGWILSLIAGFLAIREALDLDTPQTVATVAIGWVVSFVISLLIGVVAAGTAFTWRAITAPFTGR